MPDSISAPDTPPPIPPEASSPRRRRGLKPATDDVGTQDRILEAARRVFIRRGTAGARMQEIAAEAGVNQALVHYYFGSKDELAQRVFLDAAAGLIAALAPIPADNMTLEQAVERLVAGYIDTVRRTPFVPGYLLAEAQQHPERLNHVLRAAIGMVPADIVGATMQRVTRMLAEGVAAGTIRPIAPQQFLINVMSMVVFPFVGRPLLMGAFGFSEESFDAFLDERRRELPRFILNALRP